MIYLLHKNQKICISNAKWLYLGQDYLEMRDWAKILPNCQQLDYSNQIEELFNLYKVQFTTWISSQSSKYKDISWWLTPVSCKANVNSSLFLHIIYLIIALEFAERSDDLVIICENWFLLQALEDNLTNKKIAFKRQQNWHFVITLSFFKKTTNWIARWAKWIFDSASKILIAKLIPESRSTKTDKFILIHTCIDDSAFAKDFTFNNRYFPGLENFLQKSDYKVKIIPWIYNTKKSFKDCLKWFDKSKTEFLIPERYLKISDLFSAINKILKSYSYLKNESKFNDLNIKKIILRERINNSNEAGCLKFLLYAPALKRWLADGNQAVAAIDMFENLTPEKCFVSAFRKHSPETKLVGYQHIGGIPDQLLNYYISEIDFKSGFYPDQIVTNSSFTSQHLISSGIPKQNIDIGPALRFQYIFDFAKLKREQKAKYILAPLPLDIEGAVEMLYLLLGAKLGNYPVYLKSHPMLAKENILKKLETTSLPNNFSWVDGPIAKFLPEAALIIAENSTLLDAAASATPFVCVRRQLSFTYNPLTIWRKTYKICENITAKKFQDDALEIIQSFQEGTNKEQLNALSQQIISGMGQSNPQTMQVFLNQFTTSKICQNQ